MWRAFVVLVAMSGSAVADDGTTKGAVPVPGEYVEDELGTNFLDTTVTFAELPKVSAKWQKRESVSYKGRVPIALHIRSHTMLAVTFVAPVDPKVSDYPGSLKTIALFPSEDRPSWGNAFGPLRYKSEKDGGSLGPIHAAIRVKPLRDSPESERRQVVVYVPPKSKVVLVATKLVTEKKWTPLLRIDTPNATDIAVINPGWH